MLIKSKDIIFKTITICNSSYVNRYFQSDCAIFLFLFFLLILLSWNFYQVVLEFYNTPSKMPIILSKENLIYVRSSINKGARSKDN
jgi:hypothetical protein